MEYDFSKLCMIFAVWTFIFATAIVLKCYMHYVVSGVTFMLKRHKTDIIWFYVCSLVFIILGFLFKTEDRMSSLIILVLFGFCIALFSSWVRSKREKKAAELREAQQAELAKAIAKAVVEAIKGESEAPTIL